LRERREIAREEVGGQMVLTERETLHRSYTAPEARSWLCTEDRLKGHIDMGVVKKG
jgi:hypothetical protein